MEDIYFPVDVWKLLLTRYCTPRTVARVSRTCKRLHKICTLSDVWTQVMTRPRADCDARDLGEQVEQLAWMQGVLIALTGSGTVRDAQRGNTLLSEVCGLTTARSSLVVCCQEEKLFKFQHFVWPQHETPVSTSVTFSQKPEDLCLNTEGTELAARHKGCVLIWALELKAVTPLTELEDIVDLAYGPTNQLTAGVGLLKPAFRVWTDSGWSDRLTGVSDPTSMTCCYLRGGRVSVDLGKGGQVLRFFPNDGKKRVKILTALPRFEQIVGVAPVYGGRAFVTLRSCGQIDLWIDPGLPPKMLWKSSLNYRFNADCFVVAIDSEGYPLIAYRWGGCSLRILTLK